jgi:HlyD family secretion protein
MMMRLLAVLVLAGMFCGISVDPQLGVLHQALSRAFASAPFQAPDTTGPSQAGPPPSDFLTAPIERGSIEEAISATGSLKPVETVEIGSQMAGEVAKLFVDFNDEVRVGQALAQLDQRSLVAKLDEARSALNIAKANIDVQVTRVERARIDLANARASREVLVAKVDNAQALATAALDNFRRQVQLRSTNSVSTATFENARMEHASKTALVKESSAVLDLHGYTVEGAEADLRRLEAEAAQARAELPLREAALRIAQIELDRSTIRSPIDGVVVGRFISQGQTLAEGLEARAIFSVARDLARMEIHARVDETDIGRLKAGQRATFGVDAYPNRRFDAVIRQVRKAAEVNQNVVTYTVVLTTDNRDDLLLPGMTATVRIVTNRVDDALKVPLAALRFDPGTLGTETSATAGGTAVWVLDHGRRLKRVAVATGASNADQAALTSGAIKEADRVVIGQADRNSARRILGVRMWF